MQIRVSVVLALNLACFIAGCGAPASNDGTGSTEDAVTTPYKNPLRGIKGLTRERIDQGVDYAGSGPLFSVGSGTVLQVFNSGWPGGAFIAVRLSDGPAAGQVVYEAENITPSVHVGESVTADTVLGTLHDSFPNLEIGWGSPKFIGESFWAQLNGAFPDNCSTSFGINFNQLLEALGAPSGIAEGSTCSGGLPSGFPSWTGGGGSAPDSCNKGNGFCTETLQCDNGHWIARQDDPAACTTIENVEEPCNVGGGYCTATLQCDNGHWVPRQDDPNACTSGPG
jgi:hypothetical protein